MRGLNVRRFYLFRTVQEGLIDILSGRSVYTYDAAKSFIFQPICV